MADGLGAMVGVGVTSRAVDAIVPVAGTGVFESMAILVSVIGTVV